MNPTRHLILTTPDHTLHLTTSEPITLRDAFDTFRFCVDRAPTCTQEHDVITVKF